MSTSAPYGANETVVFLSITTPHYVHPLWNQLLITIQGKLMITKSEVEWLHVLDGGMRDFDQLCCFI